jgi:hypothetical protein
MTLQTTILLLHAASTLAMTGLIWFVQVVHYPLFQLGDRQRFRELAASHQARTTIVVAPLMLTEAATALLLLSPLSDVPFAPALVGAVLLTIVWLSTALVQVPMHRHLLDGYSGQVVRRLVGSNWVRTLAWTARAVIALSLL